MDTIYLLRGITFRWHVDKARANVAKHGVTFEEAAEALLDPFGSGGDASSGYEERESYLGYSFRERLLLVVYTERSDTIRLISARLPTRAERKSYE